MRGIARDLNISRWRVQQTIAAHQAARENDSAIPAGSALPARPNERGSKLDAFQSQIVQWLQRYPHMTAMRVFEELRRQGYTGGYTILRERVRTTPPKTSQAADGQIRDRSGGSGSNGLGRV